MMKVIKILIVIASFSVLTASDFDKTRFGLSVDYNKSLFNLDINKQQNITCPTCPNVSGDGYSIGFITRFPISFLSNNSFKSRLEANLEYSNHSGAKIIRDEFASLVIEEPGFDIGLEYNYSVKYSAIGFTINYSFNILNTELSIPEFSISLGAGVDYALVNNYKVTANLTGNVISKNDSMINQSCWPGKHIIYSYDKRHASILEENIPGINVFRIFYNFGLGYDFYINDFILSPNIALTTDFKLSIYKIGLNFYF